MPRLRVWLIGILVLGLSSGCAPSTPDPGDEGLRGLKDERIHHRTHPDLVLVDESAIKAQPGQGFLDLGDGPRVIKEFRITRGDPSLILKWYEERAINQGWKRRIDMEVGHATPTIVFI